MDVGVDLVPQLLNDLPLLRQQDISADPFIRCELGPVPPRFLRRAAAFGERAMGRWWSPSRRVDLFGKALLPGDLVRSALVMSFVNTAALAGALRSPRSGSPRTMAGAETEQRMERFFAAHGPGPVIRAFWAHRIYEHARALVFYRPMPEEDFISGRLHLPLVPEFCREDLLWAAAGGWVEPVLADGRVCIALTPLGESAWDRLQQAWEQARALVERERLRQRLQWLYRGGEYESMLDRIMPDHLEERARLHRTAGIWPGAAVLDVGSGPGAGIVAAGGVADLVGPRGEVIALDPQEHLLRMLVETARRRGLRNVRALVGVAERLPLPSASVDIVISEGALQFMDLEAFAAEAHRVLRPGGTLSVAFPTAAYGAAAPYFREAMARVAALTPQDGQPPPPPLLPQIGPVREALAARGFAVVSVVELRGQHDFSRPADLVLFMLQTVRLIQRSLASLPWGAQQERVQQLEAALAAVAERFASVERRVDWYACQIVAHRPAVPALRPEPAHEVLAVGDSLTVGVHEDVVYHRGTVLPLPPAAARVLRVLAQASGPLPIHGLMARLAGVSRQTVYNAMSALRRELPPTTRILLNRRAGYTLHNAQPALREASE